MPAKNVVKSYEVDSYYHIYNRGVAKQKIFLDQADKRYFLKLIDRHLNPKSKVTDQYGAPYRKFNTSIELLCFCLMGNHYHMLIYLKEDLTAITELMRSMGTAYTMYFNLKYRRVGPVFQGTFKASRISSDSYLLHISRYIHLNPREYLTYKYSSLSAYLDGAERPWLQPQKIQSLFGKNDYLEFLQDYEDNKLVLDVIKHELADS
jgi:putative transposase